MNPYPEFVLCFFGVISTLDLAMQLDPRFEKSLVTAVLPKFEVLFIVYTGINGQKWRKISRRY
jgi:hypothetical protein